MENHKHSDDRPTPSQDRQVASDTRRKLILATPPLLIGIANRPAWANMCSISGTMSGPHSGQPQVEACLGCTPGFWKANPEAWPLGYPGKADDGTVDIFTGECVQTTGNPGTSTCKVWDNSGTKFCELFPNCGVIGLDADLSLMNVLWLGDKNNNVPFGHALGAHIVAGLFNSVSFSEEYGYNGQEFVDMINNVLDNGVFPDGIHSLEELKDALDDNNNRGCPLNAHGQFT